MNNISNIKDNCTGCGICNSICPKNAITFQADEYGFYYPFVDGSLCNECGACLKQCHLESQSNALCDSEKYFGHSLDETVRRRSSSGGFFTEITKLFPKATIIGAEYVKEENIVKHTAGDIAKLRRSKYVESNMKDVPQLISEALKENKQVVFCGTPCQVAGVRKRFGNPDNLFLIDFLCHGVPSMQILNEDIKHIEKKHNKKIDDVNFRSKTQGWSKHGTLYYFDDGTRAFINQSLDTYLYGFCKNISLRNSCYDCRYCGKSHADITLGDFWGVFQYDKALDDGKGLSLCFIQTHKGKSIIDKLQPYVFIKPLDNKDVSYALKKRDYRFGLVARDKFRKKYLKLGYEKSIGIFYRKDRFKIIFRGVKRFLRE